MEKVVFSCGCSFPVEHNMVIFKPDFETLDFNCEATWRLISSGNTKGVFQLESFLGERFAQRVQTGSLEELSDLVSLIRPGCLQAFMDDGKNLVDHYIMRKFGKEPVSYLHPSLEPILQSTYGILCYQEQAIEIGKKLAGFSLSEADAKIRKVLGKKQSDKILEVKKDFLAGCAREGVVNAEEAEKIFSWIEAGQRYSFNKSHGISYAHCSYLSAYIKQHFPLVFFKHNLIHSKFKNKDKNLEMRKMIINTKSYGIDLLGPDIRKSGRTFEIENNDIRYGLLDVKNVGVAAYDYISQNIVDILQCNWVQFLFRHAVRLNSDHMESLIDAGAFDYLYMNRKRIKFEYRLFLDIKKSESLIKNVNKLDLSAYPKFLSLLEFLAILPTGKGQILSSTVQKNKIMSLAKILANPPESLEYSSEQIERLERELLNFPINCTRLDGNIKAYVSNMKCGEFASSKMQKNIVIAGILEEVKVIKTKNGDPMCFMTIMDDSGELSDIVGFSDFLENYREILIPDNTILLSGYRSYKNKKSLVACEAAEI